MASTVWLKNRNWRMSAYITCHQSSVAYSVALEWLVGHLSAEPLQVLEIGCDAGLSTLAIAKLFPSAHVVGIDRIPGAIVGAKRLCESNSAPNAIFRVFDLAETNRMLGRERFDLVLAPWVFHELFEMARAGSPRPREKRVAKRIASNLASPGRLVSFNRFPFPKQEAPRLCEILSGGGPEKIGDDTILVAEGASISSFPVTCFQHRVNTARQRVPIR